MEKSNILLKIILRLLADKQYIEYPCKYDCWWGFTSMPNTKETTPSYMDFIIRSEDSVMNFWMDKGISGWRLDVIDEFYLKEDTL